MAVAGAPKNESTPPLTSAHCALCHGQTHQSTGIFCSRCSTAGMAPLAPL
ncbi:hypothetical protein HPP92_023843, partial [Vanilla planifolia]